MTTLRSAKQKGSQLELDIEYSLKPVYPDIQRLGGKGQYMELDLESEQGNIAIEAKRHKGFSWNELEKYYDKLKKRAKEGRKCFVIFKGNRQPCLVFFKRRDKVAEKYTPIVMTFEDFFIVPFLKHKTIKRGTDNENN